MTGARTNEWGGGVVDMEGDYVIRPRILVLREAFDKI